MRTTGSETIIIIDALNDLKRFGYIVGVLCISLLLVLCMVLAALSSDRVETAAVRLATAEFSRALGTKAQVGAVEYRFPARMTIRDIYVEDRRGDTLLYVSELMAQYSPLALLKDEIRFSHVSLNGVVGNVYHTGEGEWNYQFLVDAFRREKKQKPASPMTRAIAVKDVQLNDIRLRYEDYTTFVSHADIDLHELSEDLLDAQIGEWAMTVSKGKDEFVVENIEAHLVMTDSMAMMPTMTVRLPNSRLDMSGMEVRYPIQDTIHLSQSAHEISFSMAFNEAKVVPSDLKLFIPRVQGLNDPIRMTGALEGTLDSLSFSGLSVSYGANTILEGDVSAVGLPDLDNPYLRANLTDVHTNAARLQDFLSRLYRRPVHLPAAAYRLGDIHYRGLAEGRLHDLTLHGAFRTAVGSITTDGTFRSDSLFEHMHYDARVVGRKLRLGRLLAKPKLGTATVDIASVGRIDEGQIRGDIKAHVRECTYNGYTYNDLTINGRYEPQLYVGQLGINDPHLTLAFDGVLNFKDINPEVNFNLRLTHFDTEVLDIERLSSPVQTSFSMAVDMNGARPDEMSGYMVIDSLFVGTVHDSLLMRQMQLIVDADRQQHKTITLRSDFGLAEWKGTFRYADIAPAFQAMMHHYLPSAVASPARSWQPVVFTLTADGERLRDVQRLFVAPVTLSDHPTFRANASLRPTQEPELNVSFFAPGVRAGKTPLHDLTVSLATVDTLRHTPNGGSGLALSISTEAMKMHTLFSTLAFRDTLLTHLTLRQQEYLDETLPEGWQNLTPRELQRALRDDLTQHERQRALVAAQRAGNYGGDIRLVTHFSRYNKRPLIDLHFMPGTLMLKDSLYTLGESRITYCAADTTVEVNHFLFEGGGQHIRANGLASRRSSDTLAVDLQRIDASYVVPFLLPVQTIMFNGLLTGKASVTSVLKKPQIATQVHIDSMGLNNCLFGDAEVDLYIRDSLSFHADVYKPETHRTVVDLHGVALLDPMGTWRLDMRTHSVPLAFINHWTSTVLEDLDGTATGSVVVGGDKRVGVYVLVRAQAEQAGLTLPWTGARYTIPADTIVLDSTSIRFPQVHLTDEEGNPVLVNGYITHTQFHDFALNLHVDVKNALVYDKNASDEMIQGHVYGTGTVDVTGAENDILVNANARTERNSRFRLSLDKASSAYESSFIHFVSHPDTLELDLHASETDLDNIDNAVTRKAVTDEIKRAARCLLKLNVEVNPRLLFQLVLGERNGDMIQARGTGALRLAFDTETGDTHLLGTYDIQQGTLTYTIANMIRKEFTVGEGSVINFSGDPANPQLDVTAKYRVTANLRDLFGDEIDQLTTSRTNIPVLTCLHMTGTLNNPILNFSLEFPMSDQALQQQVKQVINTDEMLMRQVIYLLVFSRFFTPDYMTHAEMATLNSTYSLLSSTVTSQINAWLSKLTNMLTLGVAIRTDEATNGMSQEYEAQFQLQPVDRLVINGNVGYRYNDMIASQPFFGDLEVEVLLTEDGQLRLKGYTHMVDKYSLRQASTIQGVGLVWKKDFNWSDAKKKEKKQKNAK